MRGQRGGDMRGELHMTCETCHGNRYPLQCRNSAAWRKAQNAPEVCPHGLPIGHSPDGVKRGDYAERQEGVFRGPTACIHLVVVPTGGCCDNEFFCNRAVRMQIPPRQCADCAYRRPHV